MKLDLDIVQALYESRRSALTSAIRTRARDEWKRLQQEGESPLTISEKRGGDTHWLLEDGLYVGGDFAACGKDLHGVLITKDRRYIERPINCVGCLKLLHRYGGDEAVEKAIGQLPASAGAASVEEGAPTAAGPAPDAAAAARPDQPRGGYF